MQQLAVEERQDVGTRTENKETNMSECANILSDTECQINSSDMANDEVKSTHGIQKQQPLDNKVVSSPGKLTYSLICESFAF